jgi:AraC family transcriptional regulator
VHRAKLPPYDNTPPLAAPHGMTMRVTSQERGFGVSAGILEGRLRDFFHSELPHHIISFHIRNPTPTEWRRGHLHEKKMVQPGMITITPAGDGGQYRTGRSCEVLIWTIEPERLHTLVESEWDTPPAAVEIDHCLGISDDRLWRLGLLMYEELKQPTHGSRLYAETLTTQLALELLRNHSSLERPAERRLPRVGDLRLRRVLEYIDDSLDQDVSLNQLAGVAGLSLSYFVAAFKQVTGKPPHRYLLERRIERAQRLLADPLRSIQDVAREAGFSSQSHLTIVFRRMLDTTPGAFRREALGLR